MISIWILQIVFWINKNFELNFDTLTCVRDYKTQKIKSRRNAPDTTSRTAKNGHRYQKNIKVSGQTTQQHMVVSLHQRIMQILMYRKRYHNNIIWNEQHYHRHRHLLFIQVNKDRSRYYRENSKSQKQGITEIQYGRWKGYDAWNLIPNRFYSPEALFACHCHNNGVRKANTLQVVIALSNPTKWPYMR